MIVRDAAAQVLREAGEPLHFREITDRVIRRGLWLSQGKQPSAVVSTQLRREIQENGNSSVFLLVSPGTFGLRELIGSTRSKTLSFTDSAQKVLERFGGGKPMHYREITAKALANGWLKTQSKTPEATMCAQLLGEIKRYQKRGEPSRFEHYRRGLFGLFRWVKDELTEKIEQHNRSVRDALHKQLLEMEPEEFEELMGRLLAEIGFEDIEVTRRSADGGIDVRGTLVVGEVIRTRMAVQVKKWKRSNRVHAPVVQQVRGSLGTHEQGLIITTSDFSKGAREEAMRPNAVPVALMNGEQLVALLIANDICITRRSHDIIELGEEAQSVDGE